MIDKLKEDEIRELAFNAGFSRDDIEFCVDLFVHKINLVDYHSFGHAGDSQLQSLYNKKCRWRKRLTKQYQSERE